MELSFKFYLRVNNIPVNSARVQYKMQDGYPIEEREFVIEDPTLGDITLDDSFIIELKQNRKWEQVRVSQLLSLILAKI